jgi:hypothetical protein
VVERVIVAPVGGIYLPAVEGVRPDDNEMVVAGDEIGVVIRSNEKHPVYCPFTGQLMGPLVLPGERVRRQQPVAWLRLDDEWWLDLVMLGR